MSQVTIWALGLTILSGLGGSLVVSVSPKLDPLYTLGLGALYVVLVIFLLVQIDKMEKTKTESLKVVSQTKKEASESLAKSEAEKEELARQLADGRRDYSTNLLERTLAATTKVARLYARELYSLQREISLATNDAQKIADAKAKAKKIMVRQLLECLRAVFQSDNRGVDTTKYPYSMFKLALFEPHESDGVKSLVRTSFDYPDGLIPSDLSKCVEINKHEHCAHVRAFLHQDIQVIEDIPSEAKRQNGSGRWEDLRPNQSKDYQSMFCAAVVRGEEESEERKVLGVLVVDTNRTRYFMENREYRIFLYKILSPFRTLLSHALTMTE